MKNDFEICILIVSHSDVGIGNATSAYLTFKKRNRYIINCKWDC